MVTRGRRTERHHYGPHRSQGGELWLPTGPPPPAGWPVAVVLHGGFWKAIYGKRLMHGVAADLATHGWAAWNLEYRRVGALGGGGWPATFDDVALGVDHLAALRGDEPLNLSSVVAIGHSAGGHLALWAAARPRLPAPPPVVAVRAAISLAGVVDLAEASALGLGGGAVDALLGGPPERVGARYALASPAELLPLGVAQLLVHGTEDSTVPVTMAHGYAERGRAAGDDVVLEVIEAATHLDVIRPGHAAWVTARSHLGRLVRG